VTGGSSGIGLAAVGALASSGARTILTGLPQHHPRQMAQALASKGLPVWGYDCDVTQAEDLAGLVQYVLDTHGRIDTVFCNAGVALDTGPHETTTDEQLDTMFDIHVRSVLRLANLAIPHMARTGGGSFIIMSSISGLRGNGLLGAYGITKAAGAQLARNLAVQWGPANVRVNAISPGVIATNFARPITDDPVAGPARIKKTPLRRFGKPPHVAGAVVWLASPAGEFVSGQNIVIDGGTLIAD
jgi:NAD(P)-dependent dehydrogenase (short-subunit alcohol dehydrogenase family)